jgi:hypothetical protein
MIVAQRISDLARRIAASHDICVDEPENFTA